MTEPTRPDLPYVDAFILDRWDQLTPALHQLFIDHNAQAAARVERLQGKPRFDREKEKERARFARNLSKWRNTDGRKLPSDEDGISQHMAMVAQYEAAHGRISDIDRATHKRTYANIRRQAEIEVEHASKVAALLKRGSWLISRRARSKPGEWCPRWSKKALAPYRELQNIPPHWEMSKVVLAWQSGEPRFLRVFSLQPNGYQTIALRDLTGSGDLPELATSGNSWDFALTREQYDQATRLGSGTPD